MNNLNRVINTVVEQIIHIGGLAGDWKPAKEIIGFVFKVPCWFQIQNFYFCKEKKSPENKPQNFLCFKSPSALLKTCFTI